MWKVVRKNKSYDKRCLKIYYNGKLINTVIPFYSWYFYSDNFNDELTRMCCRIKVLENLYWLVGQDCTYEEWEKIIEKLDSGRGVEGKTEKYSQFFNIDEKLTALESFNNR